MEKSAAVHKAFESTSTLNRLPRLTDRLWHFAYLTNSVARP